MIPFSIALYFFLNHFSFASKTWSSLNKNSLPFPSIVPFLAYFSSETSHLSFIGQSLPNPWQSLLIVPANQNCFLRGQDYCSPHQRSFSAFPLLSTGLEAAAVFLFSTIFSPKLSSSPPVMHHLSLT